MAFPKQSPNSIIPIENDAAATKSALQFRLDRPDTLSPKQLDSYLAAGWYRQGQGMFSTYSTISRKILMAAPWIRFETDTYSLSKNLRRLKSKNDRSLTYHIGRAVITPHREEMFQDFRVFFKGEFYESLQSALFCYRSEGAANIFDSREITFYKNGKLIGYSYFDVGENSVASILNIYDYEHMSHSIGMYSILLQLEWCREHGINYYYPGYAMPENPRFNYKLRVGGLNYLDQRTHTWQSWDNFDIEKTPLYEYRDALVKARAQFSRLNLRWRIGVYLNHSNPCPMLVDREKREFLAHPIFLSGDIYDDPHPLIIDYDLEEKVYRLLLCTSYARPPYPDHNVKLEEILFPVDFDVADFGFVALLTIDQVILKTDDLIEIYKAITRRRFIEWEDDF